MTNYFDLSVICRTLRWSKGNKSMYIPNDDTQNYPFCKLQLVVETFKHSNLNKSTIQNSQKSQKLVSQLIRKRYIKLLGLVQ